MYTRWFQTIVSPTHIIVVMIDSSRSSSSSRSSRGSRCSILLISLIIISNSSNSIIIWVEKLAAHPTEMHKGRGLRAGV